MSATESTVALWGIAAAMSNAITPRRVLEAPLLPAWNTGPEPLLIAPLGSSINVLSRIGERRTESARTAVAMDEIAIKRMIGALDTDVNLEVGVTLQKSVANGDCL